MIVNTFDELNPVEIQLGDTWRCEWYGTSVALFWSEIDLPEGMLREAQSWAMREITKRAPTMLVQLGLSLRKLAILREPHWRSFADISQTKWLLMWDEFNRETLTPLRHIFLRVACRSKRQDAMETAIFLKRKQLPKNRTPLADVLEWHPTKGALLLQEYDLMRDRLVEVMPDEPDNLLATRVAVMLMVETLKRPSQVLGIADKDVYCVIEGGVEEWFVRIPKVKGQAGQTPDAWRISHITAKTIKRLRARPAVRERQRWSGKLIIWDMKRPRQRRRASPHAVSGLVKQLFTGVVSPRTDEQLHVTSLRIRHTGATIMALNGHSLEEIAGALEHDNLDTASAYVDAVGAYFLPVLEKADEKLNFLFTRLGAAFTGISLDVPAIGSPVYIPERGEALTLVGGCTKPNVAMEGCTRRPFYGCYRGCPLFRPILNEAAHERAARFFACERERTEWAAGGKDRSRLRYQLEAFESGAQHVLRQLRGAAR